MAKVLAQPNYCSCIVHQARNLPDKGKHGGVNAFCTISMGKEKFVTAIRERTRTPEWQEQCDMPIVDDATVKLTVYHNNKNALSKGDFVGRAYVTLRDLQDYDRVHRRWYKLTNKDGKADKERGEIDVSLQFYSKNNTTGSVLDLATKKKHLSLKDIKQSLGSKLKSASKQRKQENVTGDNQLAEQRRRLGGGEDSTFNVRDFLDDSASESTSLAGSHMSLNSMSYNNNPETLNKKSMSLNRRELDMSRPPSSGLGSALSTVTPHSSRRSITSDYDTSSILDSASMYGGDEPGTPSPPARSQTQQQQQHREVYVGDDLPPRSNSTRKKSKEPSQSNALPMMATTKSQNNGASMQQTEVSRSLSITGDDVEAAFDAVTDYNTYGNEPSKTKSKDNEDSSSDSLFGLTTIKENTDADDIFLDNAISENHKDEDLMDDIDFNNCFMKYKQQQEQMNQQKQEQKQQSHQRQHPQQQQQSHQPSPQQQHQNEKRTHKEKKSKRTAPSTPTPVAEELRQDVEPKSSQHSKEKKRRGHTHSNDIHINQSHNDDISAVHSINDNKHHIRTRSDEKQTIHTHNENLNNTPIAMPTPKIDTTVISNVPISTTKQIETVSNELDDYDGPVDADVDELLGKLERMSSIRSSVKRKVQPKDDIMQQSFSEQLFSEYQHRPNSLKYSTLQTDKKVQSRVLPFDDIDDITTPSIDINTNNALDSSANNRFSTGYTQNQYMTNGGRTDRNETAVLPDIVGDPSVQYPRQGSSQQKLSSSTSSNQKANDNGLCVLGYQNVKSAQIYPKMRQELDYLDREELLHVIAYQSDLLKKRDTRLKDLENYTDSLLVKILEQCPSILQVGTSSSTSLYR